ncbi:MAG: hypothetical protein U1F10_11115 [Burkholderiales bacterium]
MRHEFRPLPSHRRTFVAAFLSALIAVGVAGSVTTLFQSRGQPFAELATAEAACHDRTYVSERQACVQDVVSARQAAQVAGR